MMSLLNLKAASLLLCASLKEKDTALLYRTRLPLILTCVDYYGCCQSLQQLHTQRCWLYGVLLPPVPD